MGELEQLQFLLRQALRRMDEAAPYGPEWAAAADAVADLERQIQEHAEGHADSAGSSEAPRAGDARVPLGASRVA